jgi:hypothetical protein
MTASAPLERVRASVRERVPRLDTAISTLRPISPPPRESSCLPSMAQPNSLTFARN